MKKELVIIIFSVIMLVTIVAVAAEKVDIEAKNNYAPGEDLSFKVIVYDDTNNQIPGEVSYVVENYYTDVMKEGKVNSGDVVSYIIPRDAIKGPWKITAKYNDIEVNRLFNVGELKRAKIKLENDLLIVENIGNVPYDNNLLISIGEEHQTLHVNLEVGETKRIKLTAPQGSYTIKVNDGTTENDLVFNGVSLTGNVIGLESVTTGNFFKKFPLVTLFFVALIVVSFIVATLRFKARAMNSKDSKKKAKKSR